LTQLIQLQATPREPGYTNLRYYISKMKSAYVATVVASLTSSAAAQFPSCASSCVQQAVSGFNGNFNQLCSDTGKLNTLNTCLSTASCSTGDRTSMFPGVPRLGARMLMYASY
jgi:hypothetical protein